MKLLIAWIVSTGLWLGVWMPLYILGYLATWIGLLFCNRDSEHMPILWWPWDNSHGINGTLGGNNPGWIKACNPKSFPPGMSEQQIAASLEFIVKSKSGNERKFSNRWVWVTFRNPVSNPSMYWIGIRARDYNEWTKTVGPFVFYKLTAGFSWIYSVTLKYSDQRGFYYGFGWKHSDPCEGIARFLYRISPYKKLG